MRKRTSMIAGTGLLAALLFSAAAVAANAKKEETGKEIAFNRHEGNCLACHAMPSLPDAVQPGNIGPPLIAMSARFPDKKALRDKIYDATVSNPHTVMPPVGKHGVLTEEQLNKLVDFIYSL